MQPGLALCAYGALVGARNACRVTDVWADGHGARLSMVAALAVSGAR